MSVETGQRTFATASAEDIRALREVLREFGRSEIRPNVRALEAAGTLPKEMYRRIGELGAFGCAFPESLGGSAMGIEAMAVCAEELAYAYPPLSAGMNMQGATVPLTILQWGAAAQVERYVPGLISGRKIGFNAMTEPDGGSDFVGAMRTRAVRDGGDYVLNGSKMWITNADVADVGIVYCKTDPAAGHKGVSAFLVERNTPGFQTRRIKCSVLGSLMTTNELHFTDMRVPAGQMLGEEGEGFRIAMSAMDYGRVVIAARSLGLARACLDASVEYADLRTAFGQKIGNFQMIKKMIAEMVCDVAAAQELVYGTARKFDAGQVSTRDSSIAKFFAGEAANRAAQSASEIFGGYAFSDELPISIYLNYAKLWQTGEGSANLQRVLIADDALGWKSLDRHQRAPRKLPQ
ncbi:MAG: acyl-CoA dehydrogenase family protein [Rhodoferax sp.]|nr:acyl-CoA dehydrogenase family protein [Rhodoferax sp.]MCP5264344.1 acyl-CoA dehydrogenase family protein [Rhodoferax sp.]